MTASDERKTSSASSASKAPQKQPQKETKRVPSNSVSKGTENKSGAASTGSPSRRSAKEQGKSAGSAPSSPAKRGSPKAKASVKGAAAAKQEISATPAQRFPVLLHVYDLGPVSKLLLNSWASQQKDSKLGAFHCGIEVLGIEWSYQALGGYRGDEDKDITGVTWHQPRSHPRHVYRETLELGESPLRLGEIRKILDELLKTWLAGAYHVITHNCTDFAETFAKLLLSPEPFPTWVHGIAKGLLRAGPFLVDPMSLAFFNCTSCGSTELGSCGSASWDVPSEPPEALKGVPLGAELEETQPL
jgi:hypothetical protein|eukprot:TRINITY_DN34321_c0_g2_i1.p1 TRINITY_DN34321_c0_g2~~TRINITY_DN34321_c0_g2_i1.p1  ORF type:complete len:302 (+),score=48.84 TRINITY_DN34321_c0_g2_i1:126-1031(+)